MIRVGFPTSLFCKVSLGMFTGLVETLGSVAAAEAVGPGMRLTISSPLIAADASLGDSIAVNGCCLTVVACDAAAGTFAFEAGSETLSRTNLGALKIGSSVNLERSLQLGDRLGGHLVSGHIDALGTLDEIRTEGDWAFYWFRIPAELSRQMASKGSVAVDGVSLTLVNVERQRFSVALIPHTLAVTTLGKLQVGDPVNIETDLLAKYVERQLSFTSGL
jgi:riboflavin synthase